MPLTYADYLSIDDLLSLQRPRSTPPEHDEMLFIIQHHTSELWIKLLLHELDLAVKLVRADRLSESFKVFARVAHIQRLLFEQWAVLETMTPSEYAQFRDVLGKASGFQSYQYRALEFVLGNKDANYIKVHGHDAAIVKRLEAALAEPSFTIFHYPTPDDKHPDPFLGETNWTVVSEQRPVGGDHQVVFEAAGVVLSSRLIDGQFPNVRTLLPDAYEHELRLSGTEIADVVRRISLLAQKNAPLRLSFAEGELTVSAQTQDIGEARESLPVAFEGEPMEIGFNAEFAVANDDTDFGFMTVGKGRIAGFRGTISGLKSGRSVIERCDGLRPSVQEKCEVVRPQRPRAPHLLRSTPGRVRVVSGVPPPVAAVVRLRGIRNNPIGRPGGEVHRRGEVVVDPGVRGARIVRRLREDRAVRKARRVADEDDVAALHLVAEEADGVGFPLQDLALDALVLHEAVQERPVAPRVGGEEPDVHDVPPGKDPRVLGRVRLVRVELQALGDAARALDAVLDAEHRLVSAAHDLADGVFHLLGGGVRRPDRDHQSQPQPGGGVQELASRRPRLHQSLNVVKKATTSSICSAFRMGLPRHAGATRTSPSVR